MNVSSDLGSRFLGFRFADPAIELRYRDWSIDRKIPLIQVGMLASAAGYAVYLLTVYVLEPGSFAEVFPAVLAFLGMLGAIFVATFFRALRPWLVPSTVVANCLSGMLLGWQIHELIDSPDRFALSATAVLIPVMYGTCVYQLSPLLAMIATLPFVAMSMRFLFVDHRVGDISLAMAGSMAAMQLIACNTGIFVSWVIEQWNRRAFRKDQIIERQRGQLEQSRDAIRRYVPPSVADLIIRGEAHSIDTPVRRRVTILFADMVRFTEVSDLLEPEDLTALLIDYLSSMGELVEKHGGTLNEFAGDGLMAMFGAPYPLAPEDQAKRAIAAARDMQRQMQELNARWEKLGIGRPLMIRIGVNTGTVSVGSFGSRGRMTYTAMGLETNITSRIEKEAEPGGILVSNATYRLLNGSVRCVPRGQIECRGVHYPVSVFTVIE
nr:adenylate/guanylate cyclase domain-containing protein [Panacagrimonas sp.]